MTKTTSAYMSAPAFCHHSSHVKRPMLSRMAAYGITALILLLPQTLWAQGTLAPTAQQVFLDNSGNPLNAGLVYTYVAGTETPTTTWTNSGLSVAHPNPIVLSSAGRPVGGGIYLSTSILYKFVLKTSAGATIYTQDNISPNLAATVASSDNATCGGRITLTTGTPVTTSDVTAATTVYFSPYKGNRCALYDGSSTWNISSFTELSLSLGSDAADTNYDLFLYLSTGTPTLARVAWTNATTRATALTTVDGALVLSSDTTKRYVGTYRTTTTIGQTEDSASKRFVWNYYNRVRRTLTVTDTTDSWTYTLAALRQANNSTANQVAVVVGVAESEVTLVAVAVASNSVGANVVVAIGVDSTSALATGNRGMWTTVDNLGQYPASAHLSTYPTIGYHFFAWLEYSAASGTTTWYGDGGSGLIQSGLSGTIEG